MEAESVASLNGYEAIILCSSTLKHHVHAKGSSLWLYTIILSGIIKTFGIMLVMNTTFSCKFGPEKNFLRPGGAHTPSATPMLLGDSNCIEKLRYKLQSSHCHLLRNALLNLRRDMRKRNDNFGST